MSTEGQDSPGDALGQIAGLKRGETLSQASVALIRAAIVDGVLAPGSKVTVPAVAKLLGVSATPVREALMHLNEAGLVRFEGGQIRIPSPTPEALREAFEVREALEGMAARLAATRRSEEELEQICEHARLSLEMAQAGDSAGFREQDALFHRSVADAAHSVQLSRYLSNALDLAITMRNLKRLEHSFNATSAHIHQIVAEAIAARDAEGAENAIRNHVRAVLVSLLT